MTPLTALIIYIVWVIIGCIRFYQLFGQKFRPDRWYDYVLMSPAAVTLQVLIYAFFVVKGCQVIVKRCIYKIGHK